MAVTKPLMFMVATLSLFVMIVGGLGGSILNSHNSFNIDMQYFKNNNMVDLMNDTYYQPYDINNNAMHGIHSANELTIANMTVGHYWIEYFYQIIASDSSKAVFKIQGGDNVYLWVINNPASILPGDIYRNVEIIIYQNWGIMSEANFHFSSKAILSAFDSSKGYARLVSSGLSFPYQLTVIPDANTSLSYDLDNNVHYSMYISLSHYDAAKAASGAWGMISKLMTFSMPNWNPIISTIIGSFIDIWVAVTIFVIIRSFIPTLGQLEE